MVKLSAVAAAAAILAIAMPISPSVASDDIKQFRILAQNDSGQSGTITLLGTDSGKTIVRVRVTNPGEDPEPAHVHVGPCATLDPKPKFALAPLVDGVSTTTIDIAIDELVGHGYSVNVHKSAAEAKVYVACGDLGG